MFFAFSYRIVLALIFVIAIINVNKVVYNTSDYLAGKESKNLISSIRTIDRGTSYQC